MPLCWRQCYFSCDISVSVVIVVSFQFLQLEFQLQLIFSVTITVIRFFSYTYSYFGLFNKDTPTVVTTHFPLLTSTKLEKIHFHVQVLSLQQRESRS